MANLGMKVAKNYIYNLSFQIFTILVPLITTPYISRVLGAENIGIYSYTLSISTYFIVVGNLGFPLYGQREIAYFIDDKEKRSKRFFEIIYGQFLTMGAAVFLYILFLIFGVKDNQMFFAAHAIGVLGGVINIGWLYQGMEEFRITVMRNFFIKIFSVVLLFLLVKDSNDLLRYILIINIANLIGNFIIFLDLKKFVDFRQYKVSWHRIVQHFKPALILGIPYYITSIYAVIDKTMLGIMSSQYSEVGYYEQSQKIVTFAMSIVTSLGAVFLPRLANEIANEKHDSAKKFLNIGLEITVLLAMPIAVGIMCLGKMIVPWFFGDGYEKVGGIIIIFSSLILFMGISNLIGNQYMIAAKKEKCLTVTIAIGSVINLTINAIMIPFYGAYGAAAATVISEFVKLIAQLVIVHDMIYGRQFFASIVRYGLYSVVMGVVVVVLHRFVFIQNNFVNTGVLVLIAMMIYVVELMITPNFLVKTVIHKLKTRFL